MIYSIGVNLRLKALWNNTKSLTPNPSPRTGEGSKNPVPLLPRREKALGFDVSVQPNGMRAKSLSLISFVLKLTPMDISCPYRITTEQLDSR